MIKKIISSEEEVRNFLLDIKGILIDPLFNIDLDLDILPKKKLELPTDPFTLLIPCKRLNLIDTTCLII